MFSDKQFGLSSSLIAAVSGVLSETEEQKKLKTEKTEVEINPELNNKVNDSDDEKSFKKKTVKEATHPKTEKEKKLAALAHPKDKITHKDVLVGRGVLAKEEEELDLESLTEEELEEVLKKSQPAGEWIKDFVHSDNPKFAGKSKKKRMQMALGAYYTKQKNEETDMELTDKELERLNEIAAQLNEKITPSELRAQLKAKAAAKKAGDSETKSTTNEEVEELDENWSKGASRSYLTDRIAAGKSLNNADHYLKRSKAAEKLNPSMSKELKIKYHKEMAKFHKSGYHGEHPMAASTMAQAKKEVKKHKDAAAAIKSSMNEEVELTESKTHHQLMALYHERMASAKDISDSDKEMHEKAFQQHRKASVKPEAYSSSANKMTKALLKEEVELDEAKRGRPRKNPAPDQKPGEDEEHEHIIMQLRKVVSTHGALPVKHLDGKSTKLTPQLAQHALNKHNAMKTADQKQDFEQKLHKSHDSMRAALGG